MKIILLEDEHLLNNNIKEYLELKGLNVEAYFDGAELLKNSNFEANLAILDIEVPGASGLEVIEWIKRVDENLPVIFITAYTDIKSIEKAYKLGCSDYLK
ncbi:MAG: response regulator, partial [Campylobacterales bacterium]